MVVLEWEEMWPRTGTLYRLVPIKSEAKCLFWQSEYINKIICKQTLNICEQAQHNELRMVDFVANRNLQDFDFCGKIFGSITGRFQYQCIFCTEIFILAADFERHVVGHLVKEYTFNEPLVCSVSEPDHTDLSIKVEPIHVDVDYNCFDDEDDRFDAPEVDLTRSMLILTNFTWWIFP